MVPMPPITTIKIIDAVQFALNAASGDMKDPATTLLRVLPDG